MVAYEMLLQRMKSQKPFLVISDEAEKKSKIILCGFS